MSEYIVSARKYRPDSFETLIGQDNIAKTLKNSILRGQLAHAYLFCGPRGVGKTSTARIFAKTINCANPSTGMEPCGECESCVSFKEGRSYCIHELDAASNNGVDDIKALMEQVQIPPQVGKYSVYIIDEVHMLSQSAFNAFLKTLEEPPAHAIFILCTTEKHKIIPTILSRCQTYDFNRIGVSDTVAALRTIATKESVSIDDESLHIIAKQADGAMRDALTIFDQTVAFCGQNVRYEDVLRNLNVLDYDFGFSLVDNFLAGDYASAFLTFDNILSKGFNAQYFISSLGSHFRDLLVARTGGLESLLDLPSSLKERYAEQGVRCSVKFIYDALGIIAQCEAGYKASTNQRLHIDFALMKLCFLQSAPVAQAQAQQPAPQRVQPQQQQPAPQRVQPQQPLNPEPTKAPQQPEQQPQQPVERKKEVKTGVSLSLGSLIEESGKTEPEKETVQKPDAEPMTEEKLSGYWQRLIQITSSQARLYNALKNAGTSFVCSPDAPSISFKVINESQKTWIENNILRKLESAFREMTGCEKAVLQVEVQPLDPQEEKIFLPEEQARDLMNKNPEVKELVIDLGLDIK